MPQKRQAPLHDPRGRGRALVTTLSWNYVAGHGVPDHFHDDDQLVHAVRGVMTVRTRRALWVVPPRRAVWIPSRVVHAIDMVGAVTMKTLYLAPRLARRLPRTCCVLHVSPLLAEIVAYACDLESLHTAVPEQAHLVAVLLDQLGTAPKLPLQLPTPRDARAARLAAALLADPGDDRALAALCKSVGASKRTIERVFIRETGMTLGTWRQQLSLMHGMRLIAAGAKVTTAAVDAGYSSASAFIAMFKRAMGVTPGEWVRTGSRSGESPAG
jgi:AraC-like DNA-binding protein